MEDQIERINERKAELYELIDENQTNVSLISDVLAKIDTLDWVLGILEPKKSNF